MKKLIILAFLLCSVAFSQQNATPAPTGKLQFFDKNGKPLSGGLLYAYAAGTTTPQATYTDSTATVANSNPVVLDSGGFAAVWLKPLYYKFVLTDSKGTQIFTADNVSNFTGNAAGIVSINGSAGVFTFSGSGVSCSGSTCTFAGGASLSTANTFTQSQTGPDWIASKTPAIDIRSYGAVIDGTTDTTTAFKSALAAACSTAGVVYMPCTGSGCYMAANGGLGSSGNYACSTRAVVQVKLQGNLILGSTAQWPDGAALLCDGGAINGQFVSNGPACTVTAPQVKGAMGTSVTAGTGQTFTPTFTLGSISNMVVGSAISIIDNTTLTLTSIARASNTVTAVTSSPCRVPAGTVITIAGVTDSTGTSFNITPMLITADWQTCTFSWPQTGSDGSGVVTSGTMTGVNDDSFETVVISNVAGSVATASFAHNHTSSAEWGMVGIAPPATTFNSHIFKGVNVVNNWGAGWWMNHTGEGLLDGVGGNAKAYGPSIPLEIASGFNWNIKHSSFVGTSSHFCTTACGEQGYPMAVRITSELGAADPADLNINFTDDTFITGGVKIDTNNIGGSTLAKFGGVMLRNITIEQPIMAGVLVDPRQATVGRNIVLDNVFLQDNFMNYRPYLVAYTDRSTKGSFQIQTLNQSLLNNSTANAPNGIGTVFGPYFQGGAVINGVDAFNGNLDREPRLGTPLPTLNTGASFEGEIRGSGANMGPAIIPYATSAANTDPTTWTCTGTGCSVTTAVNAPDGSTNAAELVTGSAASPYIQPLSSSFTTNVGDWIIYGGWTRPGTGNTAADGSAFNGVFSLHSFGSGEVFDGGTADSFSTAFQSTVIDNAWHPVVTATKITTAAVGSHSISFRMYGPSTNGQATRFFMPFFIYVPASAGISDKEITRWREQLLHGVVPPSMPASVLAINPALKLYWGSDVNLYRSAANTLKTDDSLVVAGSNATLPATTAASVQATNLAGTGFRCTHTDASGNITAASGDCLTGSGTVTGPGTTVVGNAVTWNSTNGTLTADAGAAPLLTTGGQTLSSANTVSGKPSGCVQFPCVVATVAPTTAASQTTTIGPTTFYTPASAGVFCIQGYVDVTVAGSAGTFQPISNYQSDSHTFQNGISGTVSATSQWSTSASSGAASMQCFYSDAHAIQYGVVASGVTGTPTIRYAFTLYQLQ